MAIYDKLKEVEMLMLRLSREISSVSAVNNIFNGCTVRFYEDDSGKSVGLTFRVEDNQLLPSFSVIENLKKVSGADDIFFKTEGGYITEFELIYYDRW